MRSSGWIERQIGAGFMVYVVMKGWTALVSCRELNDQWFPEQACGVVATCSPLSAGKVD